ncbi:MAG: hypothetical protein CMH83_18185 [Nocardioides sp.]|nr:hypothetical protein [Nocardioides sp.]
MSPRLPLLRTAVAAVGAGSLVLLSATPGAAAAPVAPASATAIRVTVANTPADSGSYEVSTDGTDTTTSGSNAPLVTALGNQPLVSVGTLAQDATVAVTSGQGSSAACAGVAGDGASLVAAGDSFCLDPGDNATISAGTFELGDVEIVRADLLAGFDQQLQAALQPVLDALVPAAQGAVQQALTSVGEPEVVLDLGAVQSQCTAGLNNASGDSQLVDAGLYVVLAGQRVDLVDLPVNPPPNTKVVTDLDVVLTAVTDALETELTTALDGALAPLAAVVDQVETQLNDNIVSAVAEQLAPLEDNILRGTLNKQSRPAPGAIEVTALDLSVLPAAAEFDVDLLSVQLGESTCGPNGRVTVTEDETDDPSPSPKPTPRSVPTAVPAGLADAPGSGDAGDGGALALGALGLALAAAGTAGYAGYRRSLG